MRIGERVAGTEQRAEVGELLGGGVGHAGRGRGERPDHGGAVEDLDLVGLALLGERHLGRGPAVGGERPRAAGPGDHEIAGLARRAPRLPDMGDRERPQADALGREAELPVGRGRRRAWTPARSASWLRARAPPPGPAAAPAPRRARRPARRPAPGCRSRPRCRAGRAAAATAGSAPARSARRRPACSTSQTPGAASTASALAPAKSARSVTLASVP